MLLEVCVDSYASAMAAIRGGADRLELCSALAVGGLTPSPVLLRQIREVSDIPIRCLMRPRAGDFLYTKEEILQMAEEMRLLRQFGADGFVIGCLTPEGDLDGDAMMPLIEVSHAAGLTLHRCIDVARNPLEVYHDAAAMGIDTILTSGGASGCMKGVEVLRELLSMEQRMYHPKIMIGAGVNASVIRALRQALPTAKAFHMSGKTEIESAMRFRKEGVPMGLPGLDEWHIQQTSEEAVREAKAALAE